MRDQSFERDFAESMLPGKGADMVRQPEAYVPKQQHYGVHRGRVEDNLDPERRGRCKVRVFGIHPNDQAAMPTETLPWAEHGLGSFGGGTGGYGDFHVPYIGDVVFVMFVGGYEDQPVMMATSFGFQGGTSQAPSEVHQGKTMGSQYPKRRVWRMSEGSRIEISEEAGEHEIKITDSAGNYFWMDTEARKLKISWDGDMEVNVTGNITTTCGQEDTRNAGIHVQDRAPRIDHN